METEAEAGGLLPQAKKAWGHQSQRKQGECSPRASGGSAAAQMPSFGTSGLQHCERIREYISGAASYPVCGQQPHPPPAHLSVGEARLARTEAVAEGWSEASNV